MTDATTLPHMLRKNAQTMAERPALREKNLGIWQTYSWGRYYEEPSLKSFDEVRAAGREFGAAHPGYLNSEIDKGAPEDLALLNYTSGTTGHPKGVMLSHANLIISAAAYAAAEDIRPSDELLCYLPMAWIGD